MFRRTAIVCHLDNRITVDSYPLLLRGIKISDAPDLAKIVDKDWNYTSTPTLDVKACEEMITALRQSLQQTTVWSASQGAISGPSLVLHCIATVKVSHEHPDGKALGVCGIRIQDYTDKEGARKRYGTVHFVMAPEHAQHPAFRDPAMRLLLDWAFRELARDGFGLEIVGLSSREGSLLLPVYQDFLGLGAVNKVREELVNVSGSMKKRFFWEMEYFDWRGRIGYLMDNSLEPWRLTCFSPPRRQGPPN